MEELARAKAVKEAELMMKHPDATEKIRTIAHLFPHMLPIPVASGNYVLFYDKETKVNITVSFDDE